MPSETERPLLRVEDLSIELPASGELDARLAVRGLSFELRAGEAVGLVGESGSGKTLTALALLGLAPARVRGRIEFEGAEVMSFGEREWRRVRGGGIGLVFQEPLSALNPVLTVGAQLVEAIRAHASLARSAARARALELLAQVALPDPGGVFDEVPHRLSGGQRQRATLAIALAGDPKLLVADEPTTALDAVLQAQMIDLLGRLRRERNLAMLLVSHDLGVVSALCERVLVLHRGELVEEGPLPATFERPRHEETRRLLAPRDLGATA